MIEKNKLYCGDNVKIMLDIPDNTIDLTVTSPPYDNLRKYKGCEWDFENVAKQLFRITKDGGVVVWIVSDATQKGSETGTSFKQALYFKWLGYNIHDTMIWNKPTMPLSHNRYEQAFEYMFVFSKGKPKTFNGIREPYADSTVARIDSGDAYSYKHRKGQENETIVKSKKRVLNPNGSLEKNVWKISPDNKLTNKQKYLLKHPARFPEEIAQKHILSWSNAGDLVLDPFCGSGTTCKVSRDLGREYIGIDISQEYISLSKRRLSE
jgi:site-specific DNA-methyltransferase (adenine-specific)